MSTAKENLEEVVKGLPSSQFLPVDAKMVSPQEAQQADKYRSEGPLVTESTGGKRYKISIRYDLLQPEFIEAMAYIMSVGADKYGDFNWQKGLFGANGGVNHAFKHLNEYMQNVKNDYGPRRMHLAQVAVNAMFEFYYDLKGLGPKADTEIRKEQQDAEISMMLKKRAMLQEQERELTAKLNAKGYK